ncbi:MAG: 3-dehydroquinate synthase, partial [Bryobacteraceae bacterium]
MKKIAVRCRAASYEVLIGDGLLPRLGELCAPQSLGKRCAIVADANVAPLFGQAAAVSLQEAGFSAELLTVPAGEVSKSVAQAETLCEQLSVAGLDRSSFLVSLGGGVLGDLAGFVAAIFLRGIPYVSVPTTLLAQVDSCIGGKTGVNSSVGKNLIGCVHHPALVLADTDVLRSLPERIWNEGLAEAIKHGIIRDAELFEMVADASSLAPRDDESWKLALPSFIERNISIKAAIVAEDELEENDLRALLNFGHTVGHAVEYAADYGRLLHGEALSLGIVAAARVSVRRAGLSLGECARIVAALQAHQLPTVLPTDISRENVLE